MKDLRRKHPSRKGIILFSGFLICACNALSARSSNARTGHADIVRDQLGYLPTNFLSVSAWKSNGEEPVAIKTYPLNGGAKRRQSKAEVPGLAVNAPFPTLYWLTCPEISKAIADLERRGYIQDFEATLKENPEFAERLVQCHKDYAKERWSCLTTEDQELLSQDNPSILRMRTMMKESGISGTNFTIHLDGDGTNVASIKCLHAHYAHFRSTMESDCSCNPVGEMIHSTLEKEFPDLVL
jgi:hypothetical protein